MSTSQHTNTNHERSYPTNICLAVFNAVELTFLSLLLSILDALSNNQLPLPPSKVKRQHSADRKNRQRQSQSKANLEFFQLLAGLDHINGRKDVVENHVGTNRSLAVVEPEGVVENLGLHDRREEEW